MKSSKKDKIIQMTKAICKDSETAHNLIKNGIEIGYMRHKAVEYEHKPKLIVCYDCGGYNHIKGSNKCKKEKICINCSSKVHSSYDCPHKGQKEGVKCPNCNEAHPATYAGCVHFKKAISNLYKNQNKPTSNFESNTNKSYSAITTSSENRIIDMIKKLTESTKDEIIKEINDKLKVLNEKISVQNMKCREGFEVVEKLLNEHELRIEDNTNIITSALNETFYAIMNHFASGKTTDVKEIKEKHTNYMNQLFQLET